MKFILCITAFFTFCSLGSAGEAIDYDKGVFKLPDDDLSSELYTLTNEVITLHGMEQYEVSNYSRYKDYCNHNLHIWRGGSYVGIGPGAHGRILKNKQYYYFPPPACSFQTPCPLDLIN